LCPESGVILRCQCNDECTVTNCCDRRGDGCGGRFAGWWCCAMLNGADFFPTCLIYLLSPRLAPPWTPALTMVRLVVWCFSLHQRFTPSGPCTLFELKPHHRGNAVGHASHLGSWLFHPVAARSIPGAGILPLRTEALQPRTQILHPDQQLAHHVWYCARKPRDLFRLTLDRASFTVIPITTSLPWDNTCSPWRCTVSPWWWSLSP